MLWEVTPAEAVYLSTMAGLARGTLRACDECGRLAAFPRVGFSHKRCSRCGDILTTRSTPAARSALLRNEKRQRWEKIYARIYMRVLTAAKVTRRLTRTERRGTKKHRLPPEATEALERWRFRAFNALLECTDLCRWEAIYGPKEKRGPKGASPILSQVLAQLDSLGRGADGTAKR